jgi:glycosyltransferase involved in cell wall biosynthesis
MPVHNEEQHVAVAMDSLLRQTLQDWELIVVDDGSLDRTGVILTEYARNDRRIRVLFKERSGLVETLNAGLAACTSDFVARMDGDDICHPQRLEKQCRYLYQHPEVDVVTCNFRHFPRQGLKVGMLAYEEWQNSLRDHATIMRDRFVESPIVHPATMFRKNVVAAVDGYRDMGWAEDYDLWLRLAEAGCRFAMMDEVLFFWRDRPERYTRTNAVCSPEAFRRCKVSFLRQGYLAGHSEVTLVGAGIEGRAWLRTLAEENIRLTRWIDIDPRKWGRVLHGAIVVAPDEVCPGSDKMLVTIGTRGARDQVRRWAVGKGLQEGIDFVCVT